MTQAIAHPTPFTSTLPALSPQESALLAAAARCNESEVARLTAEGVNVDVRDAQGRTPLILAIRNISAMGAEIRVMSQLIDAGADVDASCRPGVLNYTPLAMAVFKGNTRAMETLMNAGANVASLNTVRFAHRRERLEFFNRLEEMTQLSPVIGAHPAVSEVLAAGRKKVEQSLVEPGFSCGLKIGPAVTAIKHVNALVR